MVTWMFRHQIEKTIDVYIDDMVIKSKKEEDHLLDLAKVFEIFRHHRLHLNMSKCVFRVGSGKFLGYMTTC